MVTIHANGKKQIWLKKDGNKLSKRKLPLYENNEDFKDGMINYDSKVNYYKWVDILDLKEVNLLPKSLINIIDSNGIHHSIQKDL